MRDPVHVLCACNASYLMPLCVMLVSLVDNMDPERDLVIHIVNGDATERERENIRESIRMNRPGLEHIEICWYTIEPSLFAKLPSTKNPYLTKDAYARILVPVLLPESCERIVYLDPDMVVLADISVPYDAAASGNKVLHAAHDVGIPWVSTPDAVPDYAERGIPPQQHYFNSGFLIINLKLWRERNLTAAMIDFLVNRGTAAAHGDQDALNALLANDWAPLDNRWNQGSDILFYEIWKAAGYSRKEWLLAKKNPYIIHFSGPKKPWQKNRYAPRYSYFFKYLQKTVYRDSLPRRPRLEGILGVRAYYHLWKWVRKIPGLVKPWTPPIQI